MPLDQRLQRNILSAMGMALLSAASVAMAGPGELISHEKPAMLENQSPLVVAQARQAQNDRGTIEPENPTEVLIMQALDQATDLKVENTPLREALNKLSDKTGIRIEFARGTFARMPYGSRTALTATIEDQPLQDSLHALLRPLALTFEVVEDKLLIKPRPALERMIDRASWEELALLEKLYSQPWRPELIEELQIQFQGIPINDAEINKRHLADLALSVGTGTAGEVLEIATEQYGWTWHPDGTSIVIMPATLQIERQLEQLISVRYSDRKLKDVLLDLANRAGVLLKMDPGVLASVPPQQQEGFTLALENATIKQALEIIAGETGLGYFVEPEGIRITSNVLDLTGNNGDPSGDSAQQAIQALRSNPIVGMVNLPGEGKTSYSFFIREDDLPPEMNDMRQQRLQDAIDQMRHTLSTRPAE